MKKNYLLLLFLGISSISWTTSYNAFKAYQKKDFEKSQEILEQKQVDSPLDPLLNYNLGTTYYKQKKYDAAKESFLRAAQHSFSTNKPLHEKATFNLANSLYKNTLDMLPENWEKEKLDEKLKKRAISEISQSIESYKNLLSKDEDGNVEIFRIKTNKKAAEELLKKLQQQQQKQDKQKQDKKKQQDKQKQDKQKQDKKKQQDKQKQDKQKQDQDKKDKDKQKKSEEQKKQEQQQQSQQKPKTMEQRKREVLLSKIDKQEKNLQKARLQKMSKQQAKPKSKYQKSW
jgi:hypothetical protein